MSLIKCPECGKEISDKAVNCPSCGCPSSEWKCSEEQDIYEIAEAIVRKYPGKEKKIAMIRELREETGMDLKIAAEVIEKCLKAVPPSQQKDRISEEKREFNGVYRATLFHGLQEVRCPRCGSEDCAHYQEQKIRPGKTKTRYTTNLNPFRPFTIANKKEKVIRKDEIVTESKFVCNKCGMIFH